MFLHVVGHNQRFRVVHQSFRRSIETVSRHFHQVLYAVGELRGEMIRPPSTETHPKILGSQRWYPFLKVMLCSLLLFVGFCSMVTYKLMHAVIRTSLVLLMAPMCWLGCQVKGTLTPKRGGELGNLKL